MLYAAAAVASVPHTSERQLDRHGLVAARCHCSRRWRAIIRASLLPGGTQPRTSGRDPQEKPHLFSLYIFSCALFEIKWCAHAPTLALSKSPPPPIRQDHRPEPGRGFFLLSQYNRSSPKLGFAFSSRTPSLKYFPQKFSERQTD